MVLASYLVTALASVRAVLQACSPLVHEVCAEEEAKPSVPSWAQGGVMDKPKPKSNDFVVYVIAGCCCCPYC